LSAARFDDLKLKGYHETVDDSSPIITLFSPSDTQGRLLMPNSAISATRPSGTRAWPIDGLDGPRSVRQADREDTCRTLTYTNDKGMVLPARSRSTNTYMFTVADKITNAAAHRLRSRPTAASPATTSRRRFERLRAA
jgi:YidC/Oxa1 family membrane protein insertase